MHIPFTYGWYCWDLGEYRPFPVRYTTYWLFPYETLPSLPAVDSPFAFLAEGDDPTPTPPWLEEARTRLRRELTSLAGAAEDLGLRLPVTFLQFMSAPELHLCFRSGTGYWFTLSNRLVRCPGFASGYLIAFLRDQQDCITWCLCLTQDGDSCILALPMDAVETLPEASMDALYGALDDADGQAADGNAGTMAPMPGGDGAAVGDIRICARTFDEFIYRFWLEDEIAWKLGGLNQAPLTDTERRYLDHYQRQRHNGIG